MQHLQRSQAPGSPGVSRGAGDGGVCERGGGSPLAAATIEGGRGAQVAHGSDSPPRQWVLLCFWSFCSILTIYSWTNDAWGAPLAQQGVGG